MKYNSLGSGKRNAIIGKAAGHKASRFFFVAQTGKPIAKKKRIMHLVSKAKAKGADKISSQRNKLSVLITNVKSNLAGI